VESVKISVSSKSTGLLAAAMAVMLVLAGCAALQPDPNQDAKDQQMMLSAAGFKMMPANSPEKLAEVKALPQLKLDYYANSEGKTHYWMADANYCGCVYIGNDQNFQQYENLKFQKRLTDQQQQIARYQAETARNMDPMLRRPWWIY